MAIEAKRLAELYRKLGATDLAEKADAIAAEAGRRNLRSPETNKAITDFFESNVYGREGWWSSDRQGNITFYAENSNALRNAVSAGTVTKLSIEEVGFIDRITAKIETHPDRPDFLPEHFTLEFTRPLFNFTKHSTSTASGGDLSFDPKDPPYVRLGKGFKSLELAIAKASQQA